MGLIMGLINFAIIFVVCLALALFSIENPQVASIQIIPGLDVEAPLSIELIFAVGLGAILAWMFSVWSKLLRQFDLLRSKMQVRAKDKEIEELKEEMEQIKDQASQQQQLLPASETGGEK